MANCCLVSKVKSIKTSVLILNTFSVYIRTVAVVGVGRTKATGNDVLVSGCGCVRLWVFSPIKMVMDAL